MDRQMLTLMVCGLLGCYHTGRERLFIILQRQSGGPRLIMATCTRLYLFYLFVKCFTINKQAMDSKILGERLKQIRLMMRLTQKELAVATHLTQPVLSRLENGEEVYASVLLAILYYYQGKVSLDSLFAPDFVASKEKLLYTNREDMLQKLVRQLDLIADTISEANETSLAQISRLKKEVL